MSPQARTMQWLRKQGYTCGIVERWIERAKQRVDLFGFIDIIAFKDDMIWGIQATSGSNHAKHVTECFEKPLLRGWLHAGRQFDVISWRKLKKTGWTRRGTRFTFNDKQQIITTNYDDKL